jgi:ABC-type sulfate transport system substrate-binding protein
VIAGKQEADVVHLALPLDVTRIADAGLIHNELWIAGNGIIGSASAS